MKLFIPEIALADFTNSHFLIGISKVPFSVISNLLTSCVAQDLGSDKYAVWLTIDADVRGIYKATPEGDYAAIGYTRLKSSKEFNVYHDFRQQTIEALKQGESYALPVAEGAILDHVPSPACITIKGASSVGLYQSTHYLYNAYKDENFRMDKRLNNVWLFSVNPLEALKIADTAVSGKSDARENAEQFIIKNVG